LLRQRHTVAESSTVRRDRVLVAGIGNIFFGDDGFGVEVANRLLQRAEPAPAGVRITEFGIRGLHLAYELLDGYEVLVLIDALPIGDEPGTVALIEAELPDPPSAGDDIAPTVDAHSMDPQTVLASLAHLGGSVDRVLVVACEPASVVEGIGLSHAVAASVDRAVAMVDELLADLLSNPQRTEPPR
jgi:hydrogenase maturation protease